MKNVFHVMKINHTFYNIINDFKDFLLGELFFLFVNLIKEATILKVLSDELVLVCCDTNTHVKDDVWVFEITENFQLFKEVLLILMFPCFNIILYCNGA